MMRGRKIRGMEHGLGFLIIQVLFLDRLGRTIAGALIVDLCLVSRVSLFSMSRHVLLFAFCVLLNSFGIRNYCFPAQGCDAARLRV